MPLFTLPFISKTFILLLRTFVFSNSLDKMIASCFRDSLGRAPVLCLTNRRAQLPVSSTLVLSVLCTDREAYATPSVKNSKVLAGTMQAEKYPWDCNFIEDLQFNYLMLSVK